MNAGNGTGGHQWFLEAKTQTVFLRVNCSTMWFMTYDGGPNWAPIHRPCYSTSIWNHGVRLSGGLHYCLTNIYIDSIQLYLAFLSDPKEAIETLGWHLEMAIDRMRRTKKLRLNLSKWKQSAVVKPILFFLLSWSAKPAGAFPGTWWPGHC